MQFLCPFNFNKIFHAWSKRSVPCFHCPKNFPLFRWCLGNFEKSWEIHVFIRIVFLIETWETRPFPCIWHVKLTSDYSWFHVFPWEITTKSMQEVFLKILQYNQLGIWDSVSGKFCGDGLRVPGISFFYNVSDDWHSACADSDNKWTPNLNIRKTLNPHKFIKYKFLMFLKGIKMCSFSLTQFNTVFSHQTYCTICITQR